MFPSSSSSAGMLRRMLIEATGVSSPHIKCAEDEQSMTGHRAEQIDCQLEDIQGHGRIDGVEWNTVIADAMLSTSASPRAQNELGFSQPRVVTNMSALANDSDSDTPQELQLSPNELDDEAEDDDGDNVLSMSMDQDSSDLAEHSGATLSRLSDPSGLVSNVTNLPPRKKGRPSKFAAGGAIKSGAECPMCGKVFNNSSALAKHKLTHSSERKYVCRLCGKTFKRQDHLNGHMLTHSSKKPFECRFPSCGRSYCDARSLRRHHDNYHSRPTELSGLANRPSSTEGMMLALSGVNQSDRHAMCSGSSLSPAGSETRDMGTVSTSSDSSGLFDLELPHECELCGRRFKNLPALNGHMRLHGGYFKKDVTVATAAEAVKSTPTTSRVETTKSVLSEYMAPVNSGSGLLPTALDSQWNVPGLLLSAAAKATSSQSEPLLDQSNAFSRAATSVLPVVVSAGLSGLIGLAPGTVMSSSTLLPVDPAQLNLLLSQKVLVPVDTMKASHLATGAICKFSSEGDEAALSVNADNITSDSTVKVEDVRKRNADDIDCGVPKFSHLSTHDYTSIGGFSENESAVYWSKKAETDKAVHVRDTVVSSDSRSLNKLTVNTDTGSQKFLPSQGVATYYPAIHQVLQRNNPKVADLLEKETGQSSKLSNRRMDGSHNPTCIDETCPGCRRWTVSDADRFVRPQHHDYAAVLQEHDAFLWRQDSSGFENSDRNPLALLQEVAEAVDTRGSPMREVDDCNNLSHDSAFPVPALPGLHHKFRRKNRPEPLVIPTPVSHFGFQSRLRSPRVVADQPVVPLPVSHAPQPPVAPASGSVFMPYTPPPMLSPLRTGSGLFCSLVQPSPKSAPVGLRLGLIRSNSISSSNAVPLPPSTIVEEDEEDEEEIEEEEEEELVDVPVMETEEEIQEVDVAPPPQTDISPHINIGPEYQAVIPPYSADRRNAMNVPSKSDIVWDPAVAKHFSEDDVRHYLDFACCAAVPNSGTNKEFALHLLCLCQGDIKKAALKLMQLEPQLPSSHALHTYKYPETVVWSGDEIEVYQQAMIKFDKDFFRVSQQVKTKSVRECTEFYFLWKKVCVDEWRRMRIVRRKRIHDSLYNLRSANDQPKPTASDASFGVQSSAADTRTAVGDRGNDQIDLHGADVASIQSSSPRPDHATSASSELFPCRICGKVFDRVKSRSAHMKSHRQVESDSHHRIPAAFDGFSRS